MKLLVIFVGLLSLSFTLSSGSVLKARAKEWNIQKETVTKVRLRTENGIVEGALATTSRNKTYATFKGIPFAQPPVGPLRFKDPLPPVSWDGVLLATQQKTACVHPSGSSSAGSEDCLYLNVYTPDIGPALLPVFVYVHGGSFRQGASNENPETIVDEDVVTVMITYRVGVLGFLSLGTADVPGNAGVKDAVLALKWIKQNIAYFGGDPNNVNLHGLSAGGAVVSHLHVSPMARGLFHSVIASSGTALCDWALQKHPERMAQKFAYLLHLDNFNNDELIEVLRTYSAYDISTAGNQVEADPGGIYEDLTFVPVVEKTFEGVEPFYAKTPLEYIEDGEFSDVPTIIGYTSKEYISFYSQNTLSSFVNDDLVIVPDRWRLTATDEEVEQMAYLIREHYFGTQHFDNNNLDHRVSGIELLGDIMFAQPIIDTAAVLTQHSKSTIYHYRFSYRGILHVTNNLVQGAGHGGDMQYLYKKANQVDVDDYSSAGWVRRRLIKLFTNFAKTKNPTPGPENILLPFIWKPATPDHAHYLEINGENTLSENPDDYMTKFWKNLEEKWRNGELKSLL